MGPVQQLLRRYVKLLEQEARTTERVANAIGRPLKRLKSNPLSLILYQMEDRPRVIHLFTGLRRATDSETQT